MHTCGELTVDTVNLLVEMNSFQLRFTVHGAQQFAGGVTWRAPLRSSFRLHTLLRRLKLEASMLYRPSNSLYYTTRLDAGQGRIRKGCGVRIYASVDRYLSNFYTFQIAH